MAAYTTGPLALTGRGEPEQLDATYATAGFFPTLGVGAELGRAFGAAETVRGKDRVVVLSHGLWMRRFGGDPSVIGSSVRIDGAPYTVLGVMPAGFRFPEQGADAWVPFAFPPDVAGQRGAHYLDVVARRRPEAAAAQADAEIRTIADRLRRAYPRTNEGYTAVVRPLSETLVGDVRPALLMLLGAVGLVTLIACANVANLLLIRATRRGAEIAIRTALGAGRVRLARQLLTESLVLAAAGAAAGLALAAASLDLIVRFAPADVPRLSEVRIDGDVLAFTALWTFAAAFVFGLAPALAALRPGPMRSLRATGADAASGRGAVRLRRVLVAGQIAVALVLLVAAGLLVRSLARLSAVDPGFRAEQVLAYDLTLPEARYPDEARQAAFTEQILARMRALPGAQSAAAVFYLPLTGLSFSSSMRIGGAPEDADQPSAQLRVASADYFRTLGIPLRAGRLFGPEDRYGAPHAILASETAAKKIWPAGDALGKHVRFGARPGTTRIEGEIVGIVGDVRDDELGVGPRPEFYASIAQAPVAGFHIAIRTAGPPASARRGRSRGGPPPRPGARRQRRFDPPRDRLALGGAPALHGQASSPLRRDGASSLGRRDLRRDRLRGQPAHARDRHPHGPRRRPPLGPRPGDARRNAADALGGRPRTGRRVRGGAPPDRLPLRGPSRGPRDPRDGYARTPRSRTRGLLDPGAPGLARRAHGRAEVGVTP